MIDKTEFGVELAWAAGLFEGEGYFTLTRGDRRGSAHTFGMAINMTDRDVLETFRNVVGCGGVRERATRKHKEHWKPQFTWDCAGWKAIELAEALKPFLHSRRQSRLDEMLAEVANSRPKARDCEFCADTFVPLKKHTRFCSDECRDRAKYVRRRYGASSLRDAQSCGYVVGGAQPGTLPHVEILKKDVA